KREEASEKPKREIKSFAGNFCCDARGRPEDPTADRRADQHRGRAEQTQPSLKRQPSHSCRSRFIRTLNQASPGYKLRELIPRIAGELIFSSRIEPSRTAARSRGES